MYDKTSPEGREKAAAAPRDNGGPAFPRPYSQDAFNDETCLAQAGMSLRDYFAARAPEPPQWFIATWIAVGRGVPMPLTITQVIAQSAQAEQLDQSQRTQLAEWLRDQSWEPDDSIAELAQGLAAELDTSREQHAAATTENEIARFFTWRWYYADEMLKSRSA